ncbi:cell-division protein [Thermohalobacter berrensis]|uniref:Cell division protein FtsX n=2 Tax=Thermohalobacter berrensis TaxID=99594 RepID=A0A419SY56_9FIRM|nr:cell-division protein [Thermohalobacter berrensis]
MTMRFRMLNYIIKQGFVGIWRNRMMSFASIGSVTSMLVILGVILILALNINNMTNVAKDQFDEIQVYLEDDVSQEQIEKIGEAIKENEGVLSVIFQSKERALENMQKQWGEEGYLLEGLEENPLPNSYIIQLKDIKYANSVVDHIQGLVGIEEIKYYRDIVEKMISIANFVRIGGIIVTSILLFISIFIISNTIKLTVAARKREINIMKYVGATNGFIRGPFIVEGIILGFLGSVLAILIVNFGYQYIVDILNKKLYIFFTVYMIPYKVLYDDIIMIFTSIGVGIGTLGSIVSLKKYLNV